MRLCSFAGWYRAQGVAGLDLPAKLRRSLGAGQVLEPEAIAERLAAHDQDGDGRLSKAELCRFLGQAGLGGPWFCEMFAGTVWKKAQNAFEKEVASLDLNLLARVLHFAMARTSAPGRRYVITPEAFRGEAPRVDEKNAPVDVVAPDLAAARPPARGPSASPRPRAAPARPRGPSRTPTPRAPSGARSPAPRGRPRATSGPRRPAPASPRRAPTARGPRRPSGRPRS
ncbi:MAG: hypothetical protein AAFU79_10005 [Myxococcota bacterium]